MGKSTNTLRSFVFKHQIDRRIPYQENYTDGIISFDVDNIYPQRMEELANRSSSTMRAIELFAKFIKGNGFANKTFQDTVVNKKEQKVKDILRLVTEDYSLNKGFAFRVDYNAFLEIHSIYQIPFEWVRMGLPDEYGKINDYKVYQDWAEEKAYIIRDKQNIQTVKKFNPDKEVVQKEIEKAGGLAKYKGQLFYWTPKYGTYPLCSFDSVLNDVDTDARISRFKNRNVRNKFMPSAVIEYPGEFDGDVEREDFNNNIKSFQGDEESGSVLTIENPNPDKPLNITSFDSKNNDRNFQYHEESIKQNIRRHYVQPAALSGEVIPGKLGTSEEIRNAFEFYNSHTTDDRNIISECFKKIFENFASNINPENNFEIELLTFGQQNAINN